MAAFKIMKGPSSRIDTETTPYHEGYAWFTPDDGKFYIDAAVKEENKRICINPDAPRILLSSSQPSDLTEQDIWYKEVT